MDHIPKAMILAAGFGTRLKPYSLLRPKPLFPVLNQPLLFHLIEQLRQAGFGSILVNSHHLKEQFVDLLAGKQGIVLQQEHMELGTGGGLRLARDFFSTEPVLVTNGDIFHTIDLAGIYEEHCRSGADATLVLHDYPRFNKVEMNDVGLITGFGGGREQKKYAFTGIHVLDPSLLDIIPLDTFYNIIDCYRYWIARGKKICAHVVRDHFWTDMGTPEDYLDLHRILLTEQSFRQASPFYFGRCSDIAEDLLYEDWLCVGSGARIGRGCSLKRVVVWDGAQVPDGVQLADTIVT